MDDENAGSQRPAENLISGSRLTWPISAAN
jgi:hypothetical protein